MGKVKALAKDFDFVYVNIKYQFPMGKVKMNKQNNKRFYGKGFNSLWER